MTWHANKRVDDGVLSHPTDSKASKFLDESYPSFAADSRNVRLGLATDDFNRFGGLRSDYSIRPVVLIPYNLPPWLCIKQSYSFWSLTDS